MGVFGDINRWQTKLNAIATKYDTDDADDLHNVYRGACLGVRA